MGSLDKINSASSIQAKGVSELPKLQLSTNVHRLLKLETQYIVGAFDPIPGFFVRGKGAKLWDVDDKEYIDFICMMSAVNTGHCHPYILDKVTKAIEKVTLVNLACHQPTWIEFAQMMCQRFNYDKIISMVSGAEATDTATKTARKWGIQRKGILADKCIVLGVGGSYHGLTSGVWNLRDPSDKRKGYGLDHSLQRNTNPATGEVLEYCDLDAMRRCLEDHHQNIAGIIMECIQGHERSFDVEINYARGVYDLCKQYNILFIADEVRQGVGKTGKFFCYEHLGGNVKPDLVTLGKSITGGFFPQSYVMGSEEVMSLIGIYETASTYAYSPVGVAAAQAVLEVMDRDNLIDRATVLGTRFRAHVDSWKHPLIDYVATRGGDSNLYLVPGVNDRRIAALCLHRGLFLFPHNGHLRISFPMVMTDDELDRGASIIKESLDDSFMFGEIDGEIWTGAK